MIYKLPALNYEESLQLFSWHAFGKFHPDESYVELSKEVLYYARGLPLVLKVLGSCLFGKSALEWKRALKELKESHYENFEMLKFSFRVRLRFAYFAETENILLKILSIKVKVS